MLSASESFHKLKQFASAALVFHCRGDEAAEERVGFVRFRQKLGVELAGDEPWMIPKFDQFDEVEF